MVSAKQTKKEIKDDLDTRLKRRLMGTAVLIALAVIFLPLVFDGSGTESQFTSIEPLAPEPAYDSKSLEEIPLSDFSESTVIEFLDEAEAKRGDDNKKGDYYTSSDQQTSKQILEPPAPSADRSFVANPNKVVPDSQMPALQVKQSDSPGTDRSWLIQAASFNDKINALSLRNKLKNEEFPIVVKVGRVDGVAVFRVYVGPIVGKSNAIRVKGKLEKFLKKKTLLLKE